MGDRNAAVHYGFTRLTPDNWYVHDDALAGKQSGTPPSDTSDWTGEILAPELTDAVSPGLRARFEAARGSMLYGWFFYPQYTLALAELLRVLTVAIEARCMKAGAPKSSTRTVQSQLQWLETNGLLTDEEAQWFASVAVPLRDDLTHGFTQQTVPVGEAVEFVAVVARMLNAMFTRAAVSGSPPAPIRLGSSRWDAELGRELPAPTPRARDLLNSSEL